MFKSMKVGWSDQGSRGLREGGGNCLKYLKRGWNRTKGRENKDLKKRGKLGQGVGALKWGVGEGAGTPLRTMDGNTSSDACFYFLTQKYTYTANTGGGVYFVVTVSIYFRKVLQTRKTQCLT